MNPTRLVGLGVTIIFLGFLVVALGAFTGSGRSGTSGGFILIGPIPLVFGSGPGSGMFATVALLITVVMVVVYLLSFYFWRSGGWRESEVGTESE